LPETFAASLTRGLVPRKMWMAKYRMREDLPRARAVRSEGPL
jgi:hypothetical protein